jgi:internalin A
MALRIPDKTPEEIAEERIRDAVRTESSKLDLHDLGLTELPASIGQLAQLQLLDLFNNQLTALPESLKRLTKLQRLLLHNNPALGLPPEVLGPTWHEVERGKTPAKSKAILAYYFRTRDQRRALNEVKLLLVGRGGSGKTSIVRRLVENKFNPRQKETPGISIMPWEVKCGRQQVRVHVWDFAGQVITHAAHQFFMTHRSVYVLVLSGREPGNTTSWKCV